MDSNVIDAVPAARVVRFGEGAKIAAVVGCTLAAGLALDVVGRGGRVVPLVFGASCAVALTAIGLARRRAVGNVLGGFRFAGDVLLALAIAAGLGTVVLQGKPVELYQRAYGGWSGLLLAIGLRDLAHSCWFAGLVGLIAAGLLISMAQRWPITRRNAGFFASHCGLIAALAGAACSSLWAVRGTVDLKVGAAPVDSVTVQPAGQPGRREPLGFALRLDRFELERYDAEQRLAIYQKGAEGWGLQAGFPAEPGERHRLPGGGTIRVRGYYPDFTVRFTPEPKEGGVPVLRLVLDGREGWLHPGLARVDTADGELAVLFGDHLPASRLAPVTVLVQLEERRVDLLDASGTESFPLNAGLRLADGRVELGELWPSAQLTPSYGTRSQQPNHPAVVLEASGVPGHADGEVVLVAGEHSAFELGTGAMLTFERTEPDVRAFRSQVTLAEPRGARAASIAVNDPLEAGGWTLYQVNFDPKDPTYSGLEAVRDPGTPLVFLGFALGGLGVLYTTATARRRGVTG